MKKFWGFVLLLGLLIVCISAAGAEVSYMGKTFDENAEYIDLGDTVVGDWNAFADMIAQMPNLKRVDMWETKIGKGNCDILAERFPNIKWGWTLVIPGKDHTHLVRTDQTSFSTLHNRNTAKHTSEELSVLKYCWHLFALDIGHNGVTDISFLENMTHMRTLIIALNNITDVSVLAKLPNLEYVEMFNNKITDVTPVLGLEHLLDLNLGYNKIGNLSELKSMTWLKRLWMYRAQNWDPYPTSFEKDFKAALPTTHIDFRHDPTNGGWRDKDPHYQVIINCFGKDHLHPSSTYYPFEDSYPFSEEEQAILNGTADAAPGSEGSTGAVVTAVVE